MQDCETGKHLHVMLGNDRMLRKTALKSCEYEDSLMFPTGLDVEKDEKQKDAAQVINQASSGFQHTEDLYADYAQSDTKDWITLADLSQDDNFCLEECVQLERRWMLWHEFMKEYSCFNDWLQLAEKLAASPNSSHVPYITATEELQRFESLRSEARQRLAQLDVLNQRSLVLLSLFSGSMRTRLVDMTRECGQRWDQLSATVDTVCRRLKHFVHQREDFERQREEMAICLTDMDLRLTEVEHFSGRNTCAKLRQLQGFQETVAECAGRLNALLQQGEELIQKSEPADAQLIENQLQELLLNCARVFQGLGRLHTRLLSMRLVFEEDWGLCPDSGCPSETVLEEEGIDVDVIPRAQDHPTQVCQEQLVLEWDPSVDIGGSISHEDADSSYFSTGAGTYSTEGLLGKESWRRRTYQRHLESQSPLASACIRQPVTEGITDGMTLHQTPFQETKQFDCFFKTSTPDSQSPEPVSFNPDRISAWLVQTPRLCSRAVQTEQISQQCSSFPSNAEQEGEEVRRIHYLENALSQRRSRSPHTNNMCSSQSCDLQSHLVQRQPNPQCLRERLYSSNSPENNNHVKVQCASSESHLWSLTSMKLMKILRSPAVLFILLALLLVLVTWFSLLPQESQCHRSNSLAHSFHLALQYVNGPPPT